MNNQLSQAEVLTNFISSTSGPVLHLHLDPGVLVTLIAISICQARTFSYCLRVHLLPPEVKILFGGFAPSVGHGRRLCKILQAEWHRQTRLYRNSLFVQLCNNLSPPCGKRAWREYSNLTDRTTEFLLRLTLKHLRALTPRKTRHQSQPLHVIGDIPLPPSVEQVLSLGPKFAVEPRKSAPELLSLVRQVSQQASDTEIDRYISEGVDIISRHATQIRPPSIILTVC